MQPARRTLEAVLGLATILILATGCVRSVSVGPAQTRVTATTGIATSTTETTPTLDPTATTSPATAQAATPVPASPTATHKPPSRSRPRRR